MQTGNSSAGSLAHPHAVIAPLALATVCMLLAAAVSAQGEGARVHFLKLPAR